MSKNVWLKRLKKIKIRKLVADSIAKHKEKMKEKNGRS